MITRSFLGYHWVLFCRRTCVVALLGVSLWGGVSLRGQAQTLVSAGRIVGIVPESGEISLRTDQGYLISYAGVSAAPIRFANGSPATFADLRVNLPATVFYAGTGENTVVQKILIENPDSAQATSGSAAVPSATSLPKSAVDGDPTTEPGKAELSTPDVTKRPATVNPNQDGDITTERDRP